MIELVPLEIEEASDRLFIHFDVKGHYLNLSTFIQTADSARKVVEALDRTLFSGSGGFEVIVLPPSAGTFGQVLGIQPKHLTVLAVAGFLCTAPGEAFTKGLTGQTTSEWFEDAGVALRAGIDFAVEKLTGEGDQPESTLDALVPSDVSNAVCKVAVQLVTTMTREILESETVDLIRIGMDIGDLPDVLDARAEFYDACYNDPDVKRIGFTPEDHFPIPRSSFPERAQKPVRKKKDEEEPEWLVAEDWVRVDSPTWDQDKQRTRKWLGVDQQNRSRYFVIEDAEFWERIRRKELHFEGSDRLAVQWAYQIIGGKVRNRKVLRVLEFNDGRLAEPLTSDAIAAMLGSFTTVEASRSAPSLLDFMEE